jgi:hypothetical protein
VDVDGGDEELDAWCLVMATQTRACFDGSIYVLDAHIAAL